MSCRGASGSVKHGGGGSSRQSSVEMRLPTRRKTKKRSMEKALANGNFHQEEATHENYFCSPGFKHFLRYDAHPRYLRKQSWK